MAVNTRAKRMRALNASGGVSFVLPYPDATVDAGDRAQCLDMYSALGGKPIEYVIRPTADATGVRFNFQRINAILTDMERRLTAGGHLAVGVALDWLLHATADPVDVRANFARLNTIFADADTLLSAGGHY